MDANDDIEMNNVISTDVPYLSENNNANNTDDKDAVEMKAVSNTNMETTVGWTDQSVDREPTEEEMISLEHVSDRIPIGAWLIVVCELCERFAFYGLSGPFQNYIQFPPASENSTQPGALNRGQQTATALTTYFQFFAYLTPIAGAILADQFWGKYKTIMVACCIYMVGLLVLVLSSIPPSLNAGVAFPGLIVAMTIIGMGTGGVKSNVSPLMAEQYTVTKAVVKDIKGKRKIVDPKVTVQSMFNWFYWAINIGAISSIATTNIEKYYSFWLAYLVPLVVFTGSIVVLILGRKRYILSPPMGSLLLRAGRVVIKAIRMRSKLGKQPDRSGLLDYAKEYPASPIQDEEQKLALAKENQFIDDLKQAARACRVFLFYPFYWICYNQLGTNLVSQAAQMNVGPLPNDVLQNIDPIVLIAFIPIFDKVIYPSLRRFKINFPSIPRITCGFICVSIAMAWSAFVQHQIYQTGPNFNYAVKPCDGCQKYNNIIVAWQIPSYFFIAISEIFASITGLEYAFTQAPASMKSIVMSLFLFTSAIGSALGFALVPVTVNPKLLWMYASLSIMSFTVGIIFFLVFRNEGKVRVSPASID
ncbi:unnamed protein product [Adineta ricciae]|uniref:Uncharacterized protein n=1 Tax=Adineta ricciae TaxID=249248 RepID=A0A815N7P9_ADIRI|nr:unnamed protein product [Adineta ricciae]CAF1425913.1 unnamed protein product [Adineta ricciae]